MSAIGDSEIVAPVVTEEGRVVRKQMKVKNLTDCQIASILDYDDDNPGLIGKDLRRYLEVKQLVS